METKTLTPHEVYAKYVLKAKEQMDKESLAKKQNKLSGWLLVLWIMIILIILLIYFFMSGFNFQTFCELTDGSLGYWTIAGIIFLAMIFILIAETRKPDPIQINQIFEKANYLIGERRNNIKADKEELEIFNQL